ncbi:MAG: hypothetical protein WA996_18750 [Candidatus Promineifilaceae bacterium]
MLNDSEKRPNRIDGGQIGLFLKGRSWLLLLIFGGLFAIWAILAQWQSPITAVDLNQPWLNTALPPPGEDGQIRHSFTPKQDGLREVELLVARYGSEENNSRLDFQLQDAAGALIAAESWNPAPQDNQPYILRFPAQDDSSGQRYTLIIGGSAGNTFAPWGYDLDVFPDSEIILIGEDSAAQELHFTTRYQLSLPAALAELARLSSSKAGFIALSVLFLLLPGCLALLAGWPRTRNWDPAAWIGVALAAGVSLWPLLWLWLSTLGGGWAGWSLWSAFILGWIAAILLYVWRTGWRLRSGKISREQTVPLTRPFQKRHLLLLAILLLGLAVRLLAVRDQAFPAWVDSSRHALITTVMAGDGRVITNYAPYLPVNRFPYHFGFHTLSASLSLMTGIQIQQLLLVLGQVLNALIPLAVYAGAYLVTKRWRVALVAAFLVALPFFFPGYYATWGRMTQLAAMLVLPVALALTWFVVRGTPYWRKSWWLLAVLTGGLFLTHFRIFLLYLPFAGLVWLLSRGRNGRWLALAAALTALLSGPQIIRLFDDRQATGIGGSFPGYNELPTGYANAGWERYYLILLGVFLLIALAAAVRSRRWAWLPLFLAGWTALVALILSGRVPGVRATSLINLNSAYISFFLPLSWILAIVFDRIWVWLSFRPWPVRAAAWAVTGVLVAATAMLGIYQQAGILNPQTILAHPPDVDGLTWLDENLPPEAKVAVNSWQWLGSTWTGNDGGAWIVPLTGRESTTPPADYIYDRALAREIEAFNNSASQVEDWSDPVQAAWLQERGVTHIYVGARGGFFDPSELSRNPGISEIYHSDGVFIYSID